MYFENNYIFVVVLTSKTSLGTFNSKNKSKPSVSYCSSELNKIQDWLRKYLFNSCSLEVLNSSFFYLLAIDWNKDNQYF